MHEPNHRPGAGQILDHMREHARQLTGSDSAAGMQIAAMIRILANVYDNIHASADSQAELSGPRLWMLVRLWIDEQRGETSGITPSQLSRDRHVSRNTVSAMLRGLEEQGLIERRLDPSDRRLFRIHLTGVGRETVRREAPRQIALANALAGALSAEEQATLIHLLARLFDSLHSGPACMTAPEERGEE